MSIWETAKEKGGGILHSPRTADIVDFGVGGGLLGASMYSNIENAIHLLMGLAGLVIILIRLRWYWKRRNSDKMDE